VVLRRPVPSTLSKVDQIFYDAAKEGGCHDVVAASDHSDGPIAHIASIKDLPPLHDAFLKLGGAVGPLLLIRDPGESSHDFLRNFAREYLTALQAARVSFAEIVHENIAKTKGRFIDPDFSLLPTFDSKFLNEERLPDKFEITITQRKNGKSHLQWNGVFIGAPLTDNIRDPDGYRFHDVFHLAHAAILHWSPTFRALIQQKRKSNPKVDEAEDGGRAIVVEEGLTAWVFSRAKGLDYFKDQNSLSFDLLKTVGQFVRGYEVSECPLALWERAILQGYQVFCLVRDNNGGIVIGDRVARTISYKPLLDLRS
jgi:hypothetical protein